MDAADAIDDRERGAFNLADASPPQKPAPATGKGKGAKTSKGLFTTIDELGPPVLSAIAALGYKRMTPIQAQAIPALVSGGDCCILSKTGSGKTIGYAVPLVNRLRGHRTTTGVRGLVIAPTRELCIQIASVVRTLVKFTEPPLRVCLLVGGESMEDQYYALAANPDIIVATPGRILHHLDEIKELRSLLQTVEYVCFDECDQIFDMGMARQAYEILESLPRGRGRAGAGDLATGLAAGCQTVLVSATMPSNLAEFSRAKLVDPVVVSAETDAVLPEELLCQYLYVPRGFRDAALLRICRDLVPPAWKVLVFAATRHHCEYLTAILAASGLAAAHIYGTLDQKQRALALKAFTACGPGATQILVSTDLAARGLDVANLQCVINYHFPASGKTFVHRVGRTSRNGAHGLALSILEGEDLPYALDCLLAVGGRFHAGVPDMDAFLRNCAALRLPPMDLACLLGVHACRSGMQHLFAQLPARTLDALAEDLRACAHTYGSNLENTVRVMHNAMKQVASMRTSASAASVARAKDIVAQNTLREYPIPVPVPGADADAGAGAGAGASVGGDAMARLASVLNSYKSDTSLLEARALEAGDPASLAMLQMRRIITQRQLERARVAAELQKAQTAQQALDAQASRLGVFMTRDDIARYEEEGRQALEDKLRARVARDSFTLSADKAPEDGRPRLGPARQGGRGAIESLITDFLPEDEEGVKSLVRTRNFVRTWNKQRGRYENVSTDPGAQRHGMKERTQKLRFDDSTRQWTKAGDRDKKKSYSKWAHDSKLRIAGAGNRETVDDASARDALLGQGMGRRKAALKGRRGTAAGVQKTPASKRDRSIESTFTHPTHIAKERGRKRAQQQHQMARNRRRPAGGPRRGRR